jgi:hypothetical protein
MPQMTIIRRMRCAHWMTKATGAHLEYTANVCSFPTSAMVTRTRPSATFIHTLPLRFPIKRSLIGLSSGGFSVRYELNNHV